MSVLWNGILFQGGFYSFQIELLSAVLVFSIPLQKRRRFPIRLFAALSLSSLLFLFVLWLSEQTILEMPYKSQKIFGTFCGCFFLFVISILFLLAVYAITFKEALYCTSCAYMMQHIAYCALILLRFLTRETLPSGCAIYFLIYVLVYFAVYRAFASQMVQNGHFVTTALASAYLAFAVLAVVLGMGICSIIYDFQELHAVYAILCCVFVLYGQQKQQKQVNLQRKLDIGEQLWLQQKTQYELSKETIDIINRKCHDLKHQVSALRQIYDPGKKDEMINSLEQSVMIYDGMMDTGNESLNTVLTEKSLLCRQKHIVMTCIADGEKLVFLDVVDLYALFGNALDNAIEAVQLLPEEKRFIDLNIRMKAGVVLVRLENPYNGEHTWVDGLPKSIKEANGYHGFGIRSMRECVERYHGNLTISVEDGVFTLQMVFPLKEQNTTQN